MTINIVKERMSMSFKYSAKPVSDGLVIGQAYIFKPYCFDPPKEFIDKSQIEESIEFFEQSREKARAEISDIYQRLKSKDTVKANIFRAHMDILYDIAIDEDIRDTIVYEHYEPMYSVKATFEKYIKVIAQTDDELIRERVADMKDVEQRLLRCMQGLPIQDLSTLTKPVIIIANDLSPSNTATLNRKNVLGIITEQGGVTSHSALIARSYEIPAILGFENATEIVKNDDEIMLDAIDGVITVNPNEEEKHIFTNQMKEYNINLLETKKYAYLDAITRDNVKIDVTLNISSVNKKEIKHYPYTDGVGLFRTEFIYMGRSQLPTEDEQTEIYKIISEADKTKTVTIRTLDVGGDKKVECLALKQEGNPFLGRRALRLCLAYPDIFKTQLKAILRASIHKNLRIMFPMVSSLDDLHKAKAVLEKAKAELIEQNIDFDKNIKVGIMIETPGIAMLSDLCVHEVDFASIGTNDLIQYTLAADRQNPDVSEYYQEYHPGVFRLIQHVIECFSEGGKDISVCGEMAGNKLMTQLLIGLGLRKFSMSCTFLAKIKKNITNTTIKQCEDIARHALMLQTSSEVEEYLKKVFLSQNT